MGTSLRPLRAVTLAVAVLAAAAAPAPAGQVVAPGTLTWGTVAAPLAGHAQVFGGYARGCIAGAVALPLDGPGYQVLRPSHNRYYGHPGLIAFIRSYGQRIAALGLRALIGDMGQPRGGPMSFGHGSHQNGLDVDIWFRVSDGAGLSQAELERPKPQFMVRADMLDIDPARWQRNQLDLLRTAASFPEVERIFVNPAIKRALCKSVDGNRAWLTKIRPWWGHQEHFHVRLRCPPDSPGCEKQAPIEAGDGCGHSLDWWFKPQVLTRQLALPTSPVPARDPLALDRLPQECRQVLVGG